jgi:prepilin-type processing-associated H-X9-DG protein
MILVTMGCLVVMLWPRPLRSAPPASQLIAHQTQCRDNLRQLATAQLMYTADHQGRFCPSYQDYDSMSFTSVWMGAMAAYHGRPDGVWLCSSTTNPPSNYYRGSAEAPWTFTDPATGKTTLGSYAINSSLGLGRNFKPSREANFKPKNVFHQQSAVRIPERTPIFVDAVYWNCSLEETDAPSRNLYEPLDSVVTAGTYKRVLTQFIARHGDFAPAQAPRELESNELPGAINLAFADGHIENVALGKLWTFHWHKYWDPAKVPAPHPAPK